jgi:multicomponent Na+:H+ antiporter subunit B
MSLAEALALLAVSITGAGVALTRNTLHATIVYSIFGTALSVAFFVLHAPDVSLSELTVGTVAVPLIVLIAIAKTTRPPKGK